MSFTKIGGISYFYPNRTNQQSTDLGNQSYILENFGYYPDYINYCEAISSVEQIIYKDQKKDVWIEPSTKNIPETGGYLIVSSGTILAYESIDKAPTSDIYDSKARRAYITFTYIRGGQIQNGDTMTIDGVVYTFDTSSISQSAGTTIHIGDGQGNGTSNLAGQIQYISYFINSFVSGWESTNSTSSNSYLSIRSLNNDNSDDLAEFRLDVTGGVEYNIARGNETGTTGTYNPEPWKRPWILKNCFIVSEKYMYGLSSVSANTVSQTEHTINGSVMYKPQYSLQLMTDPAQPYGIYWKNSGDVNAKIRFNEATGSYSDSYVEFELVAATGSAGNSYSFEVREHPDIPGSDNSHIESYVTLENSGKRIVLVLGKTSSDSTQNVSSYSSLAKAFEYGGLDINDYIKYIQNNASISFSSVVPEINFSGGIDASPNLVEEGDVEFGAYTVDSVTHSGTTLAGEKDQFGRDRIPVRSNLVSATGDGKHAGFFFNVVPAGTSFPARKVINFIEYEAITGGTAGNNLTIQYTSGATAGSEVVSEVGNDITIQIEDGVSTAQQIVDAVNAQATLVKARIFGTASQAQSVSLTSSAVNLENGQAAKTNDSGFFAMLRENPNSSSLNYSSTSRDLMIFYFNDITDPDSFVYVSQFNTDSINKGLDVSQIKFERRYDSEGALLRFRHGSSIQNIRVQNAGLTYTTGTRLQTKTAGFAGNNEYRAEIVRDVSPGGEFVELNGDLITIHVNTSYTTTVADIQAEIVTAGLDSVIELVSDNPSTGLTSTYSAKSFNGGVELWSYPGKAGFGYVSINRVEHPDNRSNAWSANQILSPISRENTIAALTFRLSDFNGV